MAVITNDNYFNENILANITLQAQQYWHINHIFKRPSKLYTDNLVAVWEGEQVPEPPCVFPVVFCTNTACCGDC